MLPREAEAVGNIWVCVASGDSLTAEDIRWCRTQGWSLATCNDSFRMVPDCHLFYAMDSSWWEANADDVLSTLSEGCEIWTGCPKAAEGYGLSLVRRNGVPCGTYSVTRGLVHTGRRSGHNLINLVGWHSPDLVVLLGYDETGGHWHDKGKRLPDSDLVLAEYRNLASTLLFPVVNCSTGTAIDAFPTLPLDHVNGWHASNQAAK